MLRMLAIIVVAVSLAGCAGSSPVDVSKATMADAGAAAPVADVAASAVPSQMPAGSADATGVVSVKTSEVVGTTGRAAELPPLAAAKARMAANQLADVAKPGSNAYKIGPLDVLEISVFKVPELSKTVQVADQGTVNFPLIGEVPAVGRTARDVEQDLTSRLGKKYLQNPQVTVFVKEYNSQRVTVEGAVKKPGVFPIQGQLTLIQSLALAQGLEPNSDDSVIVFREVAGKRTAARFDVAQIRQGASPDPQLKAGDLIVAGSSATKEAFNNILKALPIATLFGAL